MFMHSLAIAFLAVSISTKVTCSVTETKDKQAG